MANTQMMTLGEFSKQAKALYDKAESINKAAAGAMTATDPNCKGTVATPDCGDGSDRAANGLPQNMNNYGEGNKEHDLHNVTKPNGTGQGEYPVPVDGSAKDKAVQSFTTPLAKLANDLMAASKAKVAEAKAPEAEKSAAPVQQDVQMQAQDVADPDIHTKLASIGALMIGSEQGRMAVAKELEKTAGVMEAQNIITETTTLMEKLASDQQNEAAASEMRKQAFAQIHESWLNAMDHPLLKQAYAQGAQDGAAAAAADEAGADPDAGLEGAISPDEVVEVLQQLLQSGAITEDQVQALIQAAQEPAADGQLTPEEITEVLNQAVQSGELTPDAANAILQQALGGGEGAAPEEAAAAAAAPEDAAAKEASAQLMQKAASCVDQLLG